MDDAEESDEDVDEVDYSDGDTVDHMASDSNKEHNSHLAIGYKNERSFVVRGNRIGVFKHNQNSLEHSTTINNVSTMDGKTFTPSKVMLHQQDSCMLLQNADQNNKIYKVNFY
jgi:hypothetical protein